MLAWCVLSTLIIILLTIRRWLRRKLGNDSRCDICIPATHEDTEDTFDVPQTSATPQPTPQDTEDNPVVPQTSATPQPTPQDTEDNPDVPQTSATPQPTPQDTEDNPDVPQTSATPQPTPQDTEDNPVVPQTSATPQPTLTPQPADVNLCRKSVSRMKRGQYQLQLYTNTLGNYPYNAPPRQRPPQPPQLLLIEGQ
ncbi:uncharacterized protein LOC128174583 [Crassostrea angulata]|uniref:uncharacterized protein LOC128174583 n=1 Tax=Magallana angulata TaxID=2784310 RepID=UPI0022B1CA29|nr:uncharacterized protein LOC128174583 [Crassostrea angulata]